MSNNNSGYGICVIGAIVLAIILGIGIYRPINKVSNRREVTMTVTDKNVKNNSDSGKYLVYCKDDKGNIAVLEITDALLAGRFDSSDTYAGIEVGKTYKFDIGGSRNRLLSWYPNIYEYSEVKETVISKPISDK